MFFFVGQSAKLLGQLEGGQERVFAGQRDVRLTGQTSVGVESEVGHPQLVKLHSVATLDTPTAKLVRL